MINKKKIDIEKKQKYKLKNIKIIYKKLYFKNLK